MRLIDADALKENWMFISEAEKRQIDNAPTVDAVSKDLFEQYKWERDTALETLEEHGLSLGQKKEKEEL